MSNKKEELLLETVDLLNKQLYTNSFDPFLDRVTSLIHDQFLKTIQLQTQIKSQPVKQEPIQYQQYIIDKDKFIPSQDLLTKFQQLYPISVNEVQKIIPQIIMPLFSQPKTEVISNFGVTTLKNQSSSFKQPWIVQKRNVKLNEYSYNPSNSLNFPAFQQFPSQLLMATKQASQTVQESKTNNKKSSSTLKQQKYLNNNKQLSQSSNGLDYWKKRRQDMMKSFK